MFEIAVYPIAVFMYVRKNTVFVRDIDELSSFLMKLRQKSAVQHNHDTQQNCWAVMLTCSRPTPSNTQATLAEG